MKNHETIILGSGKSLLGLSKSEVDYINSSDKIISINKYLLYYEKIGVIPTCHLQLDSTNLPSYYVYLKTLRKILDDHRLNSVTVYSNAALAKVARRYLRNHTVLAVNYDPSLWDRVDFRSQGWARSFDDKIFHFRGSLTSAINLASILKPANTIRLVGIDMNTNEYFFQNEYMRNRRYHDWTHKLMLKEGRHSCLINTPSFGSSSQEDCFEWVLNQVRAYGGDVVVSTPGSYYEAKGLLKYVPVVVDENVVEPASCGNNAVGPDRMLLPLRMEWDLLIKALSILRKKLRRKVLGP